MNFDYAYIPNPDSATTFNVQQPRSPRPHAEMTMKLSRLLIFLNTEEPKAVHNSSARCRYSNLKYWANHCRHCVQKLYFQYAGSWKVLIFNSDQSYRLRFSLQSIALIQTKVEEISPTSNVQYFSRNSFLSLNTMLLLSADYYYL